MSRPIQESGQVLRVRGKVDVTPAERHAPKRQVRESPARRLVSVTQAKIDAPAAWPEEHYLDRLYEAEP